MLHTSIKELKDGLAPELDDELDRLIEAVPRRRHPDRVRAAHRAGHACGLARGPVPRHPDGDLRPADGGPLTAGADAPRPPRRCPTRDRTSRWGCPTCPARTRRSTAGRRAACTSDASFDRIVRHQIGSSGQVRSNPFDGDYRGGRAGVPRRFSAARDVVRRRGRGADDREHRRAEADARGRSRPGRRPRPACARLAVAGWAATGGALAEESLGSWRPSSGWQRWCRRSCRPRRGPRCRSRGRGGRMPTTASPRPQTSLPPPPETLTWSAPGESR